ncbi:MAG TPA: hypothetical protein VL308_24220 [Gemmatimonadaceae bacterium]|jgi:uncharacterized protein YjdB|nr:hypothetical protein [Gemmatimonadaceae bacterium]
MRRSFLALAVSFTTLGSYFRCVAGDLSCSNGGLLIVVSPSTVVVAVGESVTPSASLCHDGRYDVASPKWSLGSSADSSVIALDAATGRITGRLAGTASVIATSRGAEGARVSVTVR